MVLKSGSTVRQVFKSEKASEKKKNVFIKVTYLDGVILQLIPK